MYCRRRFKRQGTRARVICHSAFIKLNKGWLSVISKNKRLNVTEDKIEVKNISHWQGTCVYLRINTNVEVDYKEFTSKYYDYKRELFEDMLDKQI